jgi:hypothetical protein
VLYIGNQRDFPANAKEIPMSILTDAAENVRQFGDALSEATFASIKQNQEIAGKAYGAWLSAVTGGLGTTSTVDLRDNLSESIGASFDLAREDLDSRREIAEQFLATAYPEAK